MARMISILMRIMVIAPLLGPLAGGQLIELIGWRGIFWTLSVVGVLTLLSIQLLPERFLSRCGNAARFMIV
ncbi:hypothetical protein [Gluconobacter oxydans]|uniref:hypothetical protein n=1 Tax=Gluconobacter oxydans TaxID=442 RepID=UPI003464527E